MCFVGEKDPDFLYLDMDIRYLGEDLLLQRLIERKGTQMIAKKQCRGVRKPHSLPRFGKIRPAESPFQRSHWS